LTRIGELAERERRSAAERVLDLLGADVLKAVHRELERADQTAPPEQVTAANPTFAVRWLARMKRWQSSLFFAALACGAAVAIVGVIDLISQLRLVVSGIGAIALVLTVFLQTRHHRGEESWIGS
jgi:hypothetical protein